MTEAEQEELDFLRELVEANEEETARELVARFNAVYLVDLEPKPEQIDNKPPRYNAGDIECIDAIKAALTPEEFRGFCKGNALKYVWREAHKGGNHDLGKAHYYLNKAKK